MIYESSFIDFILAGLPQTIALAATSLVTTEPAPIIEPSPILTGYIVALDTIRTLLPITVFLNFHESVLSESENISLTNITP